jgi:predicted kinase
MKLIIITWLPATWKTTLWQKISHKYKLPFFSKDTIKEIMFDFIWSKEDIWKEKISQSSYEILYHILEQNLIADNSVILESNFIPEFSNRVFNKLREKYSFDILQIKCNSQWEVLFERFRERSLWLDRHEWHNDRNNIEAWKETLLDWRIEALDIWWELINLDTTNFENINYKTLDCRIEIFLGEINKTKY